MRLGKILRGAAIAALVLLAAAAAGFLWLRSRGLPQRQGEAALRNSGLGYTIVRCGGCTPEGRAVTGNLTHGPPCVGLKS